MKSDSKNCLWGVLLLTSLFISLSAGLGYAASHFCSESALARACGISGMLAFVFLVFGMFSNSDAKYGDDSGNKVQ